MTKNYVMVSQTVPKAQAVKGEKIDKLDFVKFKNLFALKDTTKKVRTIHEMEILANCIFDKNYESRIYKELQNKN